MKKNRYAIHNRKYGACVRAGREGESQGQREEWIYVLCEFFMGVLEPYEIASRCDYMMYRFGYTGII